VALAAAALHPLPVRAQLDLLLRGVEPSRPRAGACGRYRFAATEPTGVRELSFVVCVERVETDGSIVLRLASGDSLEARVVLGGAAFSGRGGSILEHVRSVVEIAGGDTMRLGREDWAELPGFEPAPELPGATAESLGSKALEVGGRPLACTGRRRRESSRETKPLGDVQMTQSIEREVESWSAPEAPILGLVRATAEVRSERTLSAPVPGVPPPGRRLWHYEIELLDVWRGGLRRR
jgi:hypothetical protein